MIIQVTDGQVVGETSSVMFTVLQQGPVSMQVIIKNSGVNTMNYDFQQFDPTNGWTDLGTLGSVFNNTLQPGQVTSLLVTSAFPQVQLVANASGGAFLDFSVTRYFNRPAGGALPIMTL